MPPVKKLTGNTKILVDKSITLTITLVAFMMAISGWNKPILWIFFFASLTVMGFFWNRQPSRPGD